MDTVGALIFGERAAERRTAAGSITFDAVYDQFFRVCGTTCAIACAVPMPRTT